MSIQDLLPLVEQPSRYLGTEFNVVRKDPQAVKLKFLFAFPDRYEIGTSHFGIQILYPILNRQPDILAERVFAPAPDMAEKMKSKGVPLSGLESGRPARQFDIIGFSLLYELNYTNVLAMLDLASIPFRSLDRDEGDPLIIAGGPCTFNPEPVADFFDAMVIGDGEEVLPEMARKWIQWEEGRRKDRSELLRDWSRTSGVYIPSFYRPRYDENGFQRISPVEGAPERVSRAVVADLDSAAFPDRPLVPFGKPVHDRLRLEISRGCTRGCRFCQAGMIYRPVRERSLDTLLKLCDSALSNTGYEDLSLLSLSTSDYGCIGPLLDRLMAGREDWPVAVSLPSFRAGTMSPELMRLVKRVRKTGFTIAAEAGSQRLRDVINKNIREADILQTVADAFSLGWQVIKLYFMVGLPTEEPADLEALVSLMKRLHGLPGARGRRGKINISVNTFIPKSHTPFQWEGQLSIDAARERIRWLQERLTLPRVQFKWQAPEASFLEGLLARGDRRLSGLLEAAYRRGCQFDGWSDQFHFDRWQEAMDEVLEVSPDWFVTRRRDPMEPLPWDHLHMGVEKDWLRAELEKSLGGEETPDCRHGACQGCGVCDFERIAPRVFSASQCQPVAPAGEKAQTDGFYKRVCVTYSKQGNARFFGHLELMNILLRAIRRAGIPVKYSEGFHPLPKISFDNPLPLGMASLGEFFWLMVPGHITPGFVKERLNPQLPEGLVVEEVHLAPRKQRQASICYTSYEITLPEALLDHRRIDWFRNQETLPVSLFRKGGKPRRVDLKQAIKEIRVQSSHRLDLTLIRAPGQNVRPSDVLQHVFLLPEQSCLGAVVLKRESQAL
jgi:radical SAM family uncharacterized protein/radical SAM-linked protein